MPTPKSKHRYSGQPNNPLRKRADQLELSCSKLHKITGCPIPTIKGWLRGSHHPRPKDHESLARGLQVNVKTLRGWLKRMHPGNGIGLRKVFEVEAKKKKAKKQPPHTRSEVANAVAKYLQSGGSITVLPDEPEYDFFAGDK